MPNLCVAEELKLVSGDESSCYSPALGIGASQAAGTSGASAGATVKNVKTGTGCHRDGAFSILL